MSGWKVESNDSYHSSVGISSTGIKKILRSPAHFKYGDTPISPETAYRGTLVHTALLEPERFNKNQVDRPKGNRSQKEVKVRWEKFWEDLDSRGLLRIPLDEAKKLKAADEKLAYSEDCIVLSDSDRRMINGIRAQFQNYPNYQSLLEGVHEVSGKIDLPWDLEGLGTCPVTVKVRPDNRSKNRCFLSDIKTTTDCRDFQRTVFKLGYHIQAAMYLDVAGLLDSQDYDVFHWIAIETEPPYGIQCYEAANNSDCIRAGRASYEKGLDSYARCLVNDKWPCYDESVRSVHLPKWMVNHE